MCKKMGNIKRIIANSKTYLPGEINAGVHVHDHVPLDVDLEHSDDGDDAADRGRGRRGHQ